MTMNEPSWTDGRAVGTSETINDRGSASIEVKRWPTERPLFFLLLVLSALIWMGLAVSVVGLLYVLLLGLIFFLARVVFITHLRGNAVRLLPEQMPDLFYRVAEISGQLGLYPIPAAYVMQAGGSLNALATRFFASDFIVLFSDLLDACGDNTEARDMIIAHELGHLKAGHLRWRWFLLPGLFVPFVGSAYSRACEYTSDRYGMALCKNRDAGLRGLAILAGGGVLGRQVNLRALAGQREDLNSVWMKLGQWLATHPPIAHRLAALEPSLAEGKLRETRATLGALAFIGVVFVAPVLIGIWFSVKMWPEIKRGMGVSQQRAAFADQAPSVTENASIEQVKKGILDLVQVVEAERAQTHHLPMNVESLYEAWGTHRAGTSPPMDPFTGRRYGYETDGTTYWIWSTGPDPDGRGDDIVYSSGRGGGS